MLIKKWRAKGGVFDLRDTLERRDDEHIFTHQAHHPGTSLFWRDAMYRRVVRVGACLLFRI